MKKIVILAGILFLLTGCTVNYEVKINDDLSVNENVLIRGSDNFYETYYRTTKYNVLNNMLENFTDTLKQNNYEYQIYDMENPYIILKKKYNNIEEYINNSILFNDYFDKINYLKEDNKIKIETEGFHPNNKDDPGRFYIEKLDIMVTPKFKVTNNNATNIDEKSNTYHYIIENDTMDYNILLEFNTNRSFVANLKVKIVLIVAILLVVGFWIMFIINNKKR